MVGRASVSLHHREDKARQARADAESEGEGACDDNHRRFRIGAVSDEDLDAGRIEQDQCERECKSECDAHCRMPGHFKQD